MKSFSLVTLSLLSTTTLSAAFSKQQPQPTQNARRNFLGAGAAALVASVTNIQPAQADANVGGRIQYGEEEIMRQKGHGTSEAPVQKDLLYGVDNKLADKICNYNRYFAEMGGYFRSTEWENAVMEASGPLTYYDSVTGKPLFVAPINRSKEDFIFESKVHGWPSFRDEEVVWENVRVLRNSGETVSVDGTHLGE